MVNYIKERKYLNSVSYVMVLLKFYKYLFKTIKINMEGMFFKKFQNKASKYQNKTKQFSCSYG